MPTTKQPPNKEPDGERCASRNFVPLDLLKPCKCPCERLKKDNIDDKIKRFDEAAIHIVFTIVFSMITSIFFTLGILSLTGRM